MILTPQQKCLCELLVNAFETGRTQGDYGALVVMADGPGGVRQVTYGRSQTTEYGNLDELIEMYVMSGHGRLGEQLRPYIDKIGVQPLADDGEFKRLLKEAGNDPVMRQTQDVFFERRYFQPAKAWAQAQGFTLPLSALVIYDSFIHSGGIPQFLRKRFPEKPPASGGDEKRWVAQYVNARHDWLANHSNRLLRKTIYRTNCFKAEIARDNWKLALMPINANGVPVSA
jgi:chitosanase